MSWKARSGGGLPGRRSSVDEGADQTRLSQCVCGVEAPVPLGSFLILTELKDPESVAWCVEPERAREFPGLWFRLVIGR